MFNLLNFQTIGHKELIKPLLALPLPEKERRRKCLVLSAMYFCPPRKKVFLCVCRIKLKRNNVDSCPKSSYASKACGKSRIAVLFLFVASVSVISRASLLTKEWFPPVDSL